MPRRTNALPKPWRKRKGKKGPYTGNWIVKVNGNEVNLRTMVLDGPDGAIERSKQALAGRRSFRSDADRVVDDMETMTPAVASPPAVLPAPAVAADAAPAPAPGVQPDAVIPPPATLRALPAISSEAEAEAAATSAAAAETAAAGDAPGSGAAPDGAPDVPPEVLDEFLRQGAEVLVDAQLGLQAAIIKRRTGKIAAQVAPDSKLRKMAADAWVAQLKIWFPADVMLPPWAIALLLPLLAIPGQVAGATDPPADEAPAAAGADVREAA